MPVTFLPSRLKRLLYPLVQWTVDYPRYVRVSPDRRSWRNTNLHWVHDLNKTVPCLGKGECPYCPRALRPVTYTPCLVWSDKDGHWHKHVLPVLEGLVELLDEDLDMFSFATLRKGKRNSPVRYSRFVAKEGTPVCPPFSIADTLFAMWGIQEKVQPVELPTRIEVFPVPPAIAAEQVPNE